MGPVRADGENLLGEGTWWAEKEVAGVETEQRLLPSQPLLKRAQHPEPHGSDHGNHFPGHGRPIPGTNQVLKFYTKVSRSSLKTHVKFLFPRLVFHENTHPTPLQGPSPLSETLVIIKLTTANASEWSLCPRHCVKNTSHVFTT